MKLCGWEGFGLVLEVFVHKIGAVEVGFVGEFIGGGDFDHPV